MSIGNVNDEQIGGDHYTKGFHPDYQPWDFILDLKLGYLKGCTVKYILRHPDKGKKQDLEKAQHCLRKDKHFNRNGHTSLSVKADTAERLCDYFQHINHVPYLEMKTIKAIVLGEHSDERTLKCLIRMRYPEEKN